MTDKVLNLIMQSAIKKYGAASYLFEKELAELVAVGWIVRHDAPIPYGTHTHDFVATEKGRNGWCRAEWPWGAR